MPLSPQILQQWISKKKTDGKELKQPFTHYRLESYDLKKQGKENHKFF